LLGDGGGEQSDAEQDTLKQTMLETNPYLLALTVGVSIVHSVFEFLAFKNGKITYLFFLFSASFPHSTSCRLKLVFIQLI